MTRRAATATPDYPAIEANQSTDPSLTPATRFIFNLE